MVHILVEINGKNLTRGALAGTSGNAFSFSVFYKRTDIIFSAVKFLEMLLTESILQYNTVG